MPFRFPFGFPFYNNYHSSLGANYNYKKNPAIFSPYYNRVKRNPSENNIMKDSYKNNMTNVFFNNNKTNDSHENTVKNQFNKNSTDNFSRNKNLQNENNCIKKDSEFLESSESFFEIFGIKLYFDDILILTLLFLLYNENIHDSELFTCLLLLLFC